MFNNDEINLIKRLVESHIMNMEDEVESHEMHPHKWSEEIISDFKEYLEQLEEIIRKLNSRTKY